MNTHKVTPKDFVLWVGAMVSFYAGVVAFITLIFEYINHAFPNPVAGSYYYNDPYSSSVSYEMATLIVVVPIFLMLMRAIRRGIAADATRNDIWVRRWALFLTLFLAGGTVAIDLIVLLNTFLQGEEMTTGFLLKVLTVLLVAGAGFLHFLADLRGYWEKEPARARMVNYAVAVLVVVAIVAGFFIIGTPQEIRREKQDALRIQDLQNIQYQVVNYWQQKEALPATLADLRDPLSGNIVPVDPKTGESYTYTRDSAMTFSICATFELAGSDPYSGGRPMPTEPMEKGMEDNWTHEAGEQCFDRIIDPQRYPPYSKNQ